MPICNLYYSYRDSTHARSSFMEDLVVGRICSLFCFRLTYSAHARSCRWPNLLSFYGRLTYSAHARSCSFRICRCTSITLNMKWLVHFALMSRWMCYIYYCLHVDICLKLEPWNICISIYFNVCLFYTYIIGYLIFVALHKKKKREDVLRRTLAMPFFFLFRLRVTLHYEGINILAVRK
jgi:hypothetical protein